MRENRGTGFVSVCGKDLVGDNGFLTVRSELGPIDLVNDRPSSRWNCPNVVSHDGYLDFRLGY